MKEDFDKKVITDYFRERGKEEGVTEYVMALVSKLQIEKGFSEFHGDIQKIMKVSVGRKYHLTASRITGYEGQWLYAIYIYLK